MYNTIKSWNNFKIILIIETTFDSSSNERKYLKNDFLAIEKFEKSFI